MNNQTRKLCALLLCIVIILTLCACGGNVKNVHVDTVESKIYSEQEINDAIQIIIREFDRNWNGCTLISISYAGDKETRSESERYSDTYDIYGADELIVLTSSFEVDETGGDGSLDTNSTYNGWSWILVRSNGGTWKHVSHGYA